MICGMVFTVLFSLVGVFTYANFLLARLPFQLTTAGLGSVFFIYLFRLHRHTVGGTILGPPRFFAARRCWRRAWAWAGCC